MRLYASVQNVSQPLAAGLSEASTSGRIEAAAQATRHSTARPHQPCASLQTLVKLCLRALAAGATPQRLPALLLLRRPDAQAVHWCVHGCLKVAQVHKLCPVVTSACACRRVSVLQVSTFPRVQLSGIHPHKQVCALATGRRSARVMVGDGVQVCCLKLLVSIVTVLAFALAFISERKRLQHCSRLHDRRQAVATLPISPTL